MKKAVCIAALTSVMLGLSGCTVYFGDSAANINIADTPYTATTGSSGTAEAVTGTTAASATAAQTAATTNVSAAATAVQTTAAATSASVTTAVQTTSAPAATTVQTTPAVTAAAAAETVPAAKNEVWKALYKETLLNYKARDDISFDAKWDLQDQVALIHPTKDQILHRKLHFHRYNMNPDSVQSAVQVPARGKPQTNPYKLLLFVF